MKFKHIQDMGLFAESPNLSEPDIFVSEFEPYILKKTCQCNMKTGEVYEKFNVAIKDIHGNFIKDCFVDSLHNIPYFKLFGQPDSLITPHAHSLLEYKLQLEATEAETEKVPLYPQGLYRTVEGTPTFVLGDYLMDADTKKIRQNNTSNYYHIRKDWSSSFSHVLRLETAKEFITFFPGVSEIIFFSSLLAIVKPFLVEINYSPDFVTLIIGRSGSMKTSIVRKYALWLDRSELQEVNFQSCSRMPEILSCIDNLTGMNFLMDDLHNVYGTQAKNQQRDRLDRLTRHICNHSQCANVFITGENMKEMSIFSAYDRMFQISIPKLQPEMLQKLKEKINTLPDSFMAQLAIEFARKLISDYNNLKDTIQGFFKDYVPFGCEDATIRITRHIQILRLVEHLYRIYMCDNNSSLSCKDKFEDALRKNAAYQQKILIHQRNAEEDIDYIKSVYECLTTNDVYIKVITDINRYFPSDDTCLFDNGYIYITSAALLNSLLKYLNKPVRLTDVSKALENAGVLDRDLDTRMKKKKGYRHYAIHYQLLEKEFKARSEIF